MSNTYIVTLKLVDDRSGRARRDVKSFVRDAMNKAFITDGDNNLPDLYLNDITVAEVVE